MDKNTRKRILEALEMQPLSDEEMTARHILGRLYGPIATCIESTRNGRLYNKPLWEKALDDEIFLEKVATKALFLELGHPADREETDMKQACACIPEVPKIVGDDLYAYVDILDTPNGRLLKTLVDYGFVPGISSRGSGDVMENNQVDPETFFLETWDIVQLPAVKKARLNVCESLNTKNSKLKKALAESYQAAKDEDKDTMKQALENLNIDIEEELNNEEETSVEEIPEELEKDEVLLEAKEELVEETEEVTELADDEVKETDEEEVDEEIEDEQTEEVLEDEPAEEESENEDEEAEDDIETVDELIKFLKEYDKDTKIEFSVQTEDGEAIAVEDISAVDEEDKTILIFNVNYSDEERTNFDDTDSEIEPEFEDEEISEDDFIEPEEELESADDDGDDEVIESLKEMIRQKESMETELSDLRKAKSVGDAKEMELQEKLTRYRTAFKNTSVEAAKVPGLQSEIKALQEQLAQSQRKINSLTRKVNNAQQLKESLNSDRQNVQRLNEEVAQITKKNEALRTKLDEQTKMFTEKLQKRTDLAKAYKTRFIESITKYIESKASMLGVHPSEITSRLDENYSLKDVDAVCNQILESTTNFGRLPISRRTKASARMTESVSSGVFNNTTCDPAYGYEIDNSLLELAGLDR